MADTKIYQSSTTAPVNIAVVKYWGKRDTKLNLPTNDSLSVTLSQSDLRTHTTAACSSKFESDALFLNGKPEDVSGARTQACFRELRALRAKMEDADPAAPRIAALPLRIVSENNFPTAAGLASSAAGFAALVRAIADLYELPASPAELSIVARQGSGSACRSLFGGYVAWVTGEKADGSDSKAVEIAPASHWPEMRALILVASAAKKSVSSTSGMQTTVATSGLFQRRVDVVVPKHMELMIKAIREKDFELFGKTTMADSNSFHATCLDSSPPIFYLNDTSRAAIRAVEGINAAAGRIIAAYTFDAGPNCVVYFEERRRDAVAAVFNAILPDVPGWPPSPPRPAAHVDPTAAQVLREGVARVILTGVGGGPQRVAESLVGGDGEPLRKSSL